MNQLTTIIPSKDRALQLSGLLDSYAKHCPGAPPPTVLFTTTTEQHAKQYAQVIVEHPGVLWIPETDFGAQLLCLLCGSTYALLLVDDSVFVRHVDLDQAKALIVDPRMIGASLRLGRNTTVCYTMGSVPQEVPKLADGPVGWHCFDWAALAKEDQELVGKGEPMRWLDWAYPFDVSSTLFRTETLLCALDGKAPTGPNLFEAALAETIPRFANESPFLACMEQSGCFSLPWNRVQDVCRNRMVGALHTSVEWLAARYGEGFRLDVDAYAEMARKPDWPVGCHMEVEPRLRRAGA